jgi:hypothetical protein
MDLDVSAAKSVRNDGVKNNAAIRNNIVLKRMDVLRVIMELSWIR